MRKGWIIMMSKYLQQLVLLMDSAGQIIDHKAWLILLIILKQCNDKVEGRKRNSMDLSHALSKDGGLPNWA